MDDPDMQNKYASKLIYACICVSLLVFTVSVEAREFFRYRNVSGNLVLSHTIPNDMVRFGYDIVDEYGNLVKRVEPQLSDDEYQAKLHKEKMVEACEEAVDRVNKLYQVEADIGYAEQAGLESIDQSVVNIRARLSVMTTQREEFELEAAQLDVSGRSIPKALLDNIERAKSQEKNLRDEIDKRFSEREDLKSNNAYDRQVFALENCEDGAPPPS
jgi:hypothetical protein